MPDAVSDSSPLIHLAKIEALELISRLYSRILIPPAVWQEVVEESDGRPGAVEVRRAVAAGWMLKQVAENKALVIACAKPWIMEKLRRLHLQPNYNQKCSS
jgi:predicted nucleic acid-binding protein